MKGSRSDEFLVDTPKVRRAFFILTEEIARELRIIVKGEEWDPERNIMHQTVQSGQPVMRQRLRDHADGQRTNFDDVILEPERPRFPGQGAQKNRRIREPVVFAPKDELHLG